MCLCRKVSLEARSAVPACLVEGLNVVALEHSPELAIRVACFPAAGLIYCDMGRVLERLVPWALWNAYSSASRQPGSSVEGRSLPYPSQAYTHDST